MLRHYWRELGATISLGVPIVVGQVSQMLMGVTDSLMIGHAGAVPLAASAFGGNIFNIFYVLGLGIMVPVAVCVARAHGAGRRDEAGEYLRHGIALSVGFGVAEVLLLVVLCTQLGRFGQPPEVLAIVRPFFLLIGMSLVPVLMYLAFRQFAEAMGRPWMPMCIMLGSVALNAGLNWVFIFGHLGVPALGLTGAGISTLASRIAATLALLVWVRHDPVTRAAWPRRWTAVWSTPRFREMLRVGLPAATMLFFECTAFAWSTIMMGWLGAVPLAAHQIAITCASVAFMFPLGISMAAGMRVSHALGAGETARLRWIGLAALSLALATTATFAVAFAGFGRDIAQWFVREPDVVAVATHLLMVAALFQLFDGCQVNAASMLRGMMDVRVPAALTLVAYWGIALPIGYAAGVRGHFGPIGIWLGIAIGLAFAALTLVARFLRRTRMVQSGWPQRTA